MQCKDVEQAESIFNASKQKVMGMYGAMMKGYVTNNQANRAVDLFNEIEHPDHVVLNLLFNACAQVRTTEALTLVKKIYRTMPSTIHSNYYLLTSILDALIKCRDTASAEILFSKIKRSVINYGNLMNGFNDENQAEKTIKLFYQMKNEGFEGSVITYLCVIRALSLIGDYPLAQSITKQIPKSILIDRKIQNALIDMWGKTGCVDKARQIFEKCSNPDGITYTAMINSYALNGMSMQAIELFSQTPEEFISEATYICVLNGCSHAGLTDQARSIFHVIKLKTERITTVMVDCLSRASLFVEAQELIDQFEHTHSPEIVMYMALLSGARNEKNSDLAQNVYNRMKILFPLTKDSLTSASVLLANTYASIGDIKKSSDIRMGLHRSGAKKKVGKSMTVVDGEVYEFRAHDRSHPRSVEIYHEVQKISEELIAHGHEYDSSWITRTMDDDESVASILCGHSERLAIAWNFVANPHTSRIQVTKNLRLALITDRATKLIAAIRRCEIVVRDAYRIHHFHKSGQCSCNDYF
ncbi:unnamed protein product [Adineta ricciae]|uniref:DYW domain-containing protein n=1 Tax=Adineta ricciae TaxID=249248 RepID=A0A816CEE6_ADIRI|nr:unnamed protein product [Adineta ricciae]